MTPSPITIGPEESVITAYEKMKLHQIRRLPVVNGQKLVGIITISDIRGIIALDAGTSVEHDKMLTYRTIASAMTPDPVTIAPDENVGEAARLMMKYKVGGLPVMENNSLVGVISEADLFRLVIAESWHPQVSGEVGDDGSETITLKKGEKILVRPIRPNDAANLQATLTKMSAQTIYDRFMGYKKAFSEEEARYLTSLNYDHHMALVATNQVNEEQNIVGVARYHVLDEEKGSAEFAIVINDSHQRQGLGTYLMKRLMEYAYAHGITTFVGYVHEGNTRLLRFVQRSGLPVERAFRNGVWELRVRLKESVLPRIKQK